MKGIKMSGYDTKEEVFDAYMLGEIASIDAIQILEDEFNMTSLEAEALVDAWNS